MRNTSKAANDAGSVQFIMASVSTMTAIFAFCCVILALTDAKMYGKDANMPDKHQEKKFRMNKINLLWEKARKRLDPADLVELYGDLVIQDQLEMDAKKAAMDGKDEDGEQQALVRQKLMDIIKKYKLYTDNADRKSNMVDENETLDKNIPTLTGGKIMDGKLSKIWKKAQEVGFTDQEMDELKQEMSHHQQKLDEFNQLKNELDSNSLDNNLTEEKDRLTPDQQKQKKTDMKAKWREIKDGYASLESMKGLGLIENSTLSDPKVVKLWKSALKANFSEIELESFKEELRHFEHRLEKHNYYQKEHAMQMEKLKMDPNMGTDSAQHLGKLEEKMADQSKKIKKIHHELKSRVIRKVEL